MAKMGNVEKQTNHSNIADIVLRRIRKYCGKKTKSIAEKEKQKYKAYFEGEKGIFIIEKLTCDLIERFKLPEAIELRKKTWLQSQQYNSLWRNFNSRKNSKAFSTWKYCVEQKI